MVWSRDRHRKISQISETSTASRIAMKEENFRAQKRLVDGTTMNAMLWAVFQTQIAKRFMWTEESQVDSAWHCRKFLLQILYIAAAKFNLYLGFLQCPSKSACNAKNSKTNICLSFTIALTELKKTLKNVLSLSKTLKIFYTGQKVKSHSHLKLEMSWKPAVVKYYNV